MRPQYESIQPPETNSFKAFMQVMKEFDFPFHYHPEYELTYILSSTGVRYVGNSFENFVEDDLVLLGPNLPHCWKNTSQLESSASALVIQWNSELLGVDWLEKKEFAAIKLLHQRASKGIKFASEVALQLKPHILHLIDASPFEKIMALVRILNYLSLSNNFEIVCEDNLTKNLKYSDNERLNSIHQYLKTHYQDKITLHDVASLVCMTEESFSRFFSKLMKKSFFAFLNEYRINTACKLLIETDLLITQICYKSGYESISFFYRQFKRFKNCSPQYYRNQYKSTPGIDIIGQQFSLY